MLSLLGLAFLPATYAIPQQPHAGEPVTAAAATQIPVVTAGRATVDQGFYTWQPVSALINPKTTADDDADPVAVPSTTAAVVVPSVAVVAPLTTSTTAVAPTITLLPSGNNNPLVATPATTSTTSSAASSTQPSTSTSSSASASASFTAVSGAQSDSSSSSQSATSSVVVPLAVIGGIIVLVLAAGIAWRKRRNIQAWWAGHDDRDHEGEWDEKYRDGDFQVYGGSRNWPLNDDEFRAMPYDDGDRYGMVSSRMRPSQSMGGQPVEEVGEERGWLWGTRRPSEGRHPAGPSDRDLLSRHDQYDAMLAQSRTGYMPSEASQLDRRPSMLSRAGQALYSSLSMNDSRRTRRIAKLDGNSTNRPGTWDEHGSWRPLEGDEYSDEMAEKRLPETPVVQNRFMATPPSTQHQARLAAFSGHPDSVRKPLMAATPETSVSRSVRRWQLSDTPDHVEPYSPTKQPQSARAVPGALMSGYGSPRAGVSPRVAPELFYSPKPPGVPMPAPSSRDSSELSASNLAGIVYPSRHNGPAPPQQSNEDVFGSPYTNMPKLRSRGANAGGNVPSSPTVRGPNCIQRVTPPSSEAERPASRGPRPPSRVSQRSGSLTELVTKLLDEDDSF